MSLEERCKAFLGRTDWLFTATDEEADLLFIAFVRNEIEEAKLTIEEFPTPKDDPQERAMLRNMVWAAAFGACNSLEPNYRRRIANQAVWMFDRDTASFESNRIVSSVFR